MLKLLIFSALIFTSVACKNNEVQEPGACTESSFVNNIAYSGIINQLPDEVIVGLAKEPTAEGALGRNRNGYFHVRFQMDIAYLAFHAVKFNNKVSLEKFILAAEYSFNYQKPAGDFDLIIPDELLYLGEPEPGDLSSGIAFFTATLGSSLVLLNQSDWFQNLNDGLLTQRINALTEKFQLGLDYLKTQKEVLEQYDAHAPNRLLFDAMAFYTMGIYLNDIEAKQIGIEFIDRALAQQDAQGYFIEGEGFDSSYNGVSLRLGSILLGILSPSDKNYFQLQNAINCCAQWQASRILPSGEISTDGNTRVYPGGEGFLGEEKSVAWVDTLLSFYFMHILTNKPNFLGLAERVKSYYQ